MMKILGVSFLSDASAVVIDNGKVISAISEERINRKKLWNGVPYQAIEQSLKLAGITIDEIDTIATHGKSIGRPAHEAFKTKAKQIENSKLDHTAKQRQLDALNKRLAHEEFVYKTRTPQYIEKISEIGKDVKLYEHHKAHAASAYFASGWDECHIFTADGWGEDGAAIIWTGKNGVLEPISVSSTIDSLGYFYGSITKALGFKPHRHEGKVLGLAAYCSNPKSYDAINAMIGYDKKQKRIIGRMENGLYKPNFENEELDNLVSQYSREDIAAAAQNTLEEVVLDCISDIDSESFKIALAGGIFANVKLNQRIREHKKIEDVYVFPNMGDGGLSVGSAYLAHTELTGQRPDPLKSVLLGNDIKNEDIRQEIEKSQLKYTYYENIEREIANLLNDHKVVCVADGKMEYGPRALGNRSILFHAGDPSVNTWLNTYLNRSEFMPFAPATLAEKASECYCDLDLSSEAPKYMTMTYDCTEEMKKNYPAAVHIDGTARPQIVSEDRYPKFHRILKEYQEISGKTTIINTSFNMHEEPIVYKSTDAIRAFVSSKIPYLAIGNYLVEQTNEIAF